MKTMMVLTNVFKIRKMNWNIFRYASHAALMSSNVTVVKLVVSTVFHLSGIVCAFFKCVGHVEALIGYSRRYTSAKRITENGTLTTS